MANEEEFAIKMSDEEARRKMASMERRLAEMFDKNALKVAAFNQALSLGTRALSGMVDFLRSGVKSALDFDRTTRHLTVVLRTLGDTGGHWLHVLQSQSSELERLTGISDEVIRGYQVMALNAGANADEVDKLLRAAISLSNGFDMELGSAIRNLIKTQSGLTGELGEAIPWIRTLSKEQLQAGEAIDLVNAKLGDQLTTLTQGGSGAVVGLGLAWANLGEELGKFATQAETGIGVLERLAAAIQRMADGLTNIRNLDPKALLQGYLGTLTAPFAGIPGAVGAGLLGAGAGGVAGAEGVAAAAAAAGGVGRASGTIDFGAKETMKWEEFSVGRSGRGRGKRDTTLDFGAGGEEEEEKWQEFVIGPDGNAYTTENWQTIMALTEDANQWISDILDVHVDRRRDLMEKETVYLKEQLDARAKMEKESHEATSKLALQTTKTIVGAINAFAQGGLVGMLQYAAGVATAFGMQSIASGAAHEALAESLAFIPGMQAAAAGLAASAANEIAVGTALVAGGQIAQAGISLGRQAATGGFADWNVLTGTQGGGGGSGGGGGIGIGVGAGGGVGDNGYSRLWSPAQDTFTPEQERQITINLVGPVYDGAQAGVMIAEKIAEAKRQGLI